MYKNGLSQFLPFIVTIVMIIVTNLLWGIVIGLGVSIFFIIKRSYENALYSNFEEMIVGDHNELKIELGEVVSFFNKGHLHRKLNHVKDGAKVIVDGSKNKYMDFDILDLFEDFLDNAKSRNIEIEFHGLNAERSEKLYAFIEKIK